MLAYLIKGNYLCEMGKTRRLDISLPEDIYEDVRNYAYNKKYELDPQDAIVLQILRDNKETSLDKIAALIRSQHKIQRRVEGLRTMAIQCGIPYKL